MKTSTEQKGDGITFPVTPLVSQVILQNLYAKAKDRKLWSTRAYSRLKDFSKG